MNTKRVAWGAMWLAGGIVPVGLMAFDLAGLSGVHLRGYSSVIGRDFANLYAGGQMVLHGEAWRVYELDSYRAWLWEHFLITDPQNYSYPPFSLFLGAMLALLPYPAALAAWWSLGAAFFMLAARPWLPRGMPVWLAPLTPAALLNFYTGQYGLVIGALWLLTFDNLGRRDRQAGFTAGLLTIKPHLGVVLALVLLRRVRAALVACAVCAALVGLSALVFPGLWHDYLANVPGVQRDILLSPAARFYFRMMPSAFASFRFSPYRMGIHAATAAAALVIAAPLYRAPLRELCFPAATLTFLVVPYAFTYDMTVACLGYAILLYGRWNSLPVGRKLLLAFAFGAPQITMAGLPVAPLLLAVLWIQVSEATSKREPALATGASSPDIVAPVAQP